MLNSSFLRIAVLAFVTTGLAVLPIMQSAQAAIIPTDAAIEIAEHGQQVERVNELLAQESVRDAMITLGIDPADAAVRVQALTSAELQELEQHLADLPAGATGVVEVVGIVAVVLIILELLGVTDVFKAI